MRELWGGETREAIDNFPVSGRPIPVGVVRWLGRIKAAAARVNADLGLLDPARAQRIARSIRESNGGLPKVKALGLPLSSAGGVQVSMNLVDFEVTSILQAYEAVERQAEVRESELIGLAPAAALNAEIAGRVKLRDWSPDMILENRLAKLHLI